MQIEKAPINDRLRVLKYLENFAFQRNDTVIKKI